MVGKHGIYEFRSILSGWISADPVKDGEYLEGENQLWADPDIGHAVEILIGLVDEPAFAKAIGERAQNHMRMNYSDLAIGNAISGTAGGYLTRSPDRRAQVRPGERSIRAI